MTVEVTVADMNRAREWFDQAVADGLIRRGSVKDYPLVQMLAAHRHAAEVATRERCALIAATYAEKYAGDINEPISGDEIASAIRAGSTGDKG